MKHLKIMFATEVFKLVIYRIYYFLKANISNLLKGFDMRIEEDKHARFKRIVEIRTNRILKDIKLISNLANRSHYEYSDEEVRIVFSAIKKELATALSAFEKYASKGKDKKFQLELDK